MEKTHNLIEQSTTVAICTDSIKNDDIANSIIALTKYLQNKGKTVGVIIAETPVKKYKALFKKHDVVYTNSATPLRYVVSINYGKSGVEKVLHDIDEQNQKVMFYIIPTDSSFDFDDIEYSHEGSNYDLTITIGLSQYSEMGKVYETAEYLFKENSVIAISEGSKKIGDEFISVGSGSYSKAVRTVIGDNLDDEIRSILVDALVEDIKFLEGGVDKEQVEELSEITASGFDFNELLQRTYFSKSYKNLDLQIKLMTNIRVDKRSRVIWSIVSKDDMKFAGVDRNTLDTKGRIIFNISDEFDIAISAYEVEKDLFKIVLESNLPEKYSAINLANVYDGRGNERHSVFVIKDTPRKDIEKNLFLVMENVFGIRASATGVSVKNDTTKKPDSDGKDILPGYEKPEETSITTDSPKYKGVEKFAEDKQFPLTEPVVNGKNEADITPAEEPVVVGSEVAVTKSEYDDLLD